MAFIIKPEYVQEVLDRLCGMWAQCHGEQSDSVGPQDAMYKFFDREQMTLDEIEELEKHRT